MMLVKDGEVMESSDGHFRFPLAGNFTESSFVSLIGGRGVTVVGVFGKSGGLAAPSKAAALVDDLLQRDAFCARGAADSAAAARGEPLIEGYHDRYTDRVFLHLRSDVFDARALLDECRAAAAAELDGEAADGYLRFLSRRRHGHARQLLFLFHVCHLLIVSHPSHTFDISYVYLFQALESMRAKLQPHVTDELRKRPELAPKDWINQGRLCPPRMIFYFATSPIALRGTKGTQDLVKRDGKVSKHPAIRKLEFSLEDQIYRILRKARVLPSSGEAAGRAAGSTAERAVAAAAASENLLFVLPPRDGYVYVSNGDGSAAAEVGGRATADIAQSIVELGRVLASPSSAEDMAGPFSPYFYNQTVQEFRSSGRSFARFLQPHLEAVGGGARSGGGAAASRAETGSGSDKDERLSSAAAVVVHPDGELWYKTADALYAFLTASSSVENRLSSALAGLADVDATFSQNRCAKAMPQAVATYKEGLPQHYLQSYHRGKLLQAMSLFSVQGRGYAVPKYAELLAEECTSYWQSGRQICEEISLTGHSCTNRKHKVSGSGGLPDMTRADAAAAAAEDDDKKSKKILPTMAHSSGVSFTSACNCGRRQAARDDPFTLADANCGFYAELEEDCCKDLEHVAFPAYEQASADFTAKTTGLTRSASSLKELKAAAAAAASSAAKDGGAIASSSADGAEKALESLDLNAADPAKDTLATLALTSSSAAAKRQSLGAAAAAVECIAHMLTKETPPGKLPAVASWSLVLLGNSSLYSHTTGVQQPGFASSSKFLLPWDIPLKRAQWKDIQENWPNLADNALKKSSFNPGGKGLDMGLTVKIFLGIEYECPRGHRFMAAGPDKAQKSVSGPSLRDAAFRVVGSDMPLYMPCALCRPAGRGPLTAQLMRVHIVTPKAPMHVTLFPQVVPCPNGPVFYTGWPQPVKLSISSYWVLRLPAIYWGEEGSHLPPVEPPPLAYGLLLKGLLGVTEDFNRGK